MSAPGRLPGEANIEKELAGPRQRGFALAAALLATILIAALLAALFFAVGEETRTGSAVARRVDALAAAQSALELGLDALRARSPDRLSVGAVESQPLEVDGFPAVVHTTRLDSTLFWLVAVVGDPRSPSATASRVGILANALRSSSDSTTVVRIPDRAWSELF